MHNIASLRKVFGENEKFDVKLKYVNEDGYFKKAETYGVSANWNILNGKKVEGRNSWKHKLSVGAYVDIVNGDYYCGSCNVNTGKIERIHNKSFENQFSAGVKVKLNLNAARKRHNLKKNYGR